MSAAAPELELETAVPEISTIIHFTDDAGVAGISASGYLDAGSFVGKPGEVPSGASQAQIESFYEIGAGKGANSITLDVPASNVGPASNGATTSGGASQWQLINNQPTFGQLRLERRPEGLRLFRLHSYRIDAAVAKSRTVLHSVESSFAIRRFSICSYATENHRMGYYLDKAKFRVGSEVRVAPTEALDEFYRNWKYHHKLQPDQLSYGGTLTTVKTLGFYHGGDPLYELNGVPGIWHESCLEQPT